MKYTACLFDLYGTLVDIHTEEDDPRVWKQLARFYEAEGAVYRPADLRQRYWELTEQESREVRERCFAVSQPEIQLENVFARLFQEKGINPSREVVERAGWTFRQASTEFIHLYDGAVELLQALRKSGRKVYLLSNAQHIFTMPEIKMLGLESLFDGIWLSSDYGCKKPDPAFYNTLLNSRYVLPEMAVMVGNDAACDTYGAKALGLAAVYIRSDISPDEPLPQADYVLEHMDLYKVREILLQE